MAKIKTGFVPTGWFGTEYSLMNKLLTMGHHILYCEAHYYWATANYKKHEIFQYCEGDTVLIKCQSKRSFLYHLRKIYKFLKEHHPSLAEEMKSNVKYFGEIGL